MATHTMVPVNEYLSTAYSPDCDYVDGEVQERNLGELDHSDLQMRFLKLLSTPAAERYIRANPEIRVQVASTRFRVPDVCVRKVPAAREQIIRTAPLLCIEVLSPEDRAARVRERVRDFLDMGVREVWVADPVSRSVVVYSGAASVEHISGELTVPETPVTLSLADVFKVLDEY
ncbi:MAG TPA: Uma2 family endonuclease [Acidobacteriaceae bacterium]